MKKAHSIIGLILITCSFIACTAYDLAQINHNKGEAAYKKGDYATAIESYKKAVAQIPSPWRYEKLARAYEENGNHQKAIETYKQCLEQTYAAKHRDYYDKNPNRRGNIMWNIIKSYEALNNLTPVIPFIEQLVVRDPRNDNYFRQLGYVHNKLEHYSKAIQALKAAVALNFQDATSYNNLGYAYAAQKKYDAAFEAYGKAVTLCAECFDFRVNYAHALSARREYSKAAQQYEKAIVVKPDNVNFLLNLANVRYKEGAYVDALEVTDKTLNLATMVGVGAQIKIEGEYPAIVSVYSTGPAQKAGLQTGDQIIEVDEQSTKEWDVNTVIQKIRGPEGSHVSLKIRRSGVTELFEKTLTRETLYLPEAYTVLGLRSLILRKLGRHDEALKDAENADFSKDSEIVQLAIGAAYLYREKYEMAIETLAAIKDSANARILAAIAHVGKKDFYKAINIYTAISEEDLSPKDIPLWNDRTVFLTAMQSFVTSQIEEATRLKDRGHYRKALEELGTVLRIADDRKSDEICRIISRIISMEPQLSKIPEGARRYSLQGDVLIERGNFEDAIGEYRKAIQTAPYLAKLYFNAAVIYGELNKYPQAIHHMKLYLALAPEAPNARAVKDQVYKWEFMMKQG